MLSPHRPFKEQLKDLLALHKGERNAFIVVLGLCLLGIGWAIHRRVSGAHPVEDLAALKAAWEPMRERMKADSARWKGSDRQSVERELVLFPFDPNHLPMDRWVALGLSEKQAAAIHRYETNGGRFRSKKDLARMRVVDPGLFAQWEAYIQLPDSVIREDGGSAGRIEERKWPTHERPDVRSTPEVKVELNTADSLALVGVRGIGPSFAKGILKYRNRLGGFHSLDQLAEVYVLRDKPDALERIRQAVVLDATHLRRFNLNTVTAEELGPHPYAGWKVAKALVAYRQSHGPFKDVAG
ncbi:MAG TPA: helix-hairpin-helix domain-containing protein, partial [Flavobacteriales bacterium]